MADRKITTSVRASEKALEKLRKSFQSELDELGDEIRATVVLPLCKKHNLTYVSGNGTFYFDLVDKAIGDECLYDALGGPRQALPRDMKTDLYAVAALLNTEVIRGDSLSWYVGDVRKEDLS